MMPKEYPKDDPPGNDRVKEPLDGPIAAAFASPARQASHGDPSCHRQQSHDDTAELAHRGHGHVRVCTV